MARLWSVGLFICLLVSGCTSSSRLANPLGLDLDPVRDTIDRQRPVPVVFPAGGPGSSVAESHGQQWQVMSDGYPPYVYE